MDLFGLEIAVNKADLIILGRAAVLVLLVLFLLHGISDFLVRYTSFVEEKNDEREREMNLEVAEIESQLSDPNYDQRHYEREQWEEWYHNEKIKGDLKLTRIVKFSGLFDLTKRTLTDYGLVCAVAVLAIIAPTSLSTALDWLRA